MNIAVALPKMDSTSRKPEKVTLDVGGRKFITLTSTLDESRFLSALVSGRWDHNQQEDGSFFIDADPDLFKDILEYLRRLWMPLYWDREKGHDIARYKALLQEAEYYVIPRLSQWLLEQRYLEAIAVTTTVAQRQVPKDGRAVTFPGCKPGVHLEWHENDVYFCPGLTYPLGRHQDLDDCKPSCFEARKKFELPSIKERSLIAVMKDESVVFNHEVCRPVP